MDRTNERSGPGSSWATRPETVGQFAAELREALG